MKESQKSDEESENGEKILGKQKKIAKARRETTIKAWKKRKLCEN